jgi:hypothetical protein
MQLDACIGHKNGDTMKDYMMKNFKTLALQTNVLRMWERHASSIGLEVRSTRNFGSSISTF